MESIVVTDAKFQSNQVWLVHSATWTPGLRTGRMLEQRRGKKLLCTWILHEDIRPDGWVLLWGDSKKLDLQTGDTLTPIAIPITENVGLGDAVAMLTSAFGIPPCGGCKERQWKLNQMVPKLYQRHRKP